MSPALAGRLSTTAPPGKPRTFIFLIYLFYLFIFDCVESVAAHGLSSCAERGLLFVAVHGLLIAVASLVVEHGL